LTCQSASEVHKLNLFLPVRLSDSVFDNWSLCFLQQWCRKFVFGTQDAHCKCHCDVELLWYCFMVTQYHGHNAWWKPRHRMRHHWRIL